MKRKRAISSSTRRTTAAILHLGTMGNVHTATCRAFTAAEMDKIMGGFKQAGLDAQAEEFLAAELNNPATTDDLANACENAEQAVQVYTAARIAISPDSGAEMAFLADLASKLGVDAKLAAHIDAAARTAA